jgi:hypothetical protein
MSTSSSITKPNRSSLAWRPARSWWVALAVVAATLNASAQTLLFDFGAPESATETSTIGEVRYWNNVPAGIGSLEFEQVPNLLDQEGTPTDVSLEIVARFNSSNENGSVASGLYPATATRDSLYGNTEAFNSLENIVPSFRIFGLNPADTYALTFYASRLGVADNRETRFTVLGQSEAFIDLDAANNVTNVAHLTQLAPDAEGALTVTLTPGPNNNNANHFTYLGVLRIDPPSGPALFIDFGAGSTPTDLEEPASGDLWNNIVTAIGTSDTGAVEELLATDGSTVPYQFRMVRRFNGANLNGTTAATPFPSTATQDSLFGNTETFSGLADVFPSFKLTGLPADHRFAFTFFGSRTGVSDNRETRYTVTGASSAFADLNTANNIDNTATVSGIQPDASGEIVISLSPGPANNNGNHFTYLGALRVEATPVLSPQLLIDFGAAGTPTDGSLLIPRLSWNNVTTAVGSSDTGMVQNLVMADGSVTPVALAMVARFNGANESGTQNPAPFPTSATRDSLFGNTEPFSGLENVFPRFRLTGLLPSVDYRLSFYASRLGAGDIRETRYTVTGATVSSVDLDASNNEENVAVIATLRPSATGEFLFALDPGPNNDNGNHFTYLGVLQLDWEAPEPSTPPSLSTPTVVDSTFRFRLTGTAGSTYRILGSSNLVEWSQIQTVTLNQASTDVEIPAPSTEHFYQAAE